ncbi:5,10-methylenetetrahydrofolate reductase [Staphylothermus hellenicus]|uniref:5 10-methylenetetrahydrofolate reductase-like protein n=1 Tax=Staphylothermus hellenicus (strain DSM 12710 / JCM 10830 / BK20S6-10-b1 / P8) TaxID=591019 RepID=D7DBH1_STAHD|nr:5,10-methylenetetrahydrofolate reductase [Staphylothermus hellenicus]ADI31518.1 5 10-methylenetetrahydrofolate reductase-like protein [Staphylothermus hellenicus DSM 12710]
MDYLFELVPWKKKLIDEIVDLARDFFSIYTIPEGPGGYPGIYSLATAMYLKYKYDLKAFPHIRLYDINRLALLSIANAVEAYGLEGLVLLRGDKPWKGIIVEDIGTEEALSLLKKKGYRFEKGAIISLRYPYEKIIERIRLGADFYHVINYDASKDQLLTRIYREANRLGVKIYVFILLGIGGNKGLFAKLNQPYISPGELKDRLEALRNMCDGVVLSTPLEPLEGIRVFMKYA